MLKHAGATAGILANQIRAGLVSSFPEYGVILAYESTYFIGAISGQTDSGFAADGISSNALSP